MIMLQSKKVPTSGVGRVTSFRNPTHCAINVRLAVDLLTQPNPLTAGKIKGES
jgi:hypothetical protein